MRNVCCCKERTRYVVTGDDLDSVTSKLAAGSDYLAYAPDPLPSTRGCNPPGL